MKTHKNDKKILMSGNDACGEGALLAGCTFYAGYPITPQNELTEFMARRMEEAGGVFIQSESEVAAINMIFGAAATGARAMTSSSSPGISLKQEGISYIAACELPVVIVNIMRGGPGLGNIAPAQSDYFQATRGGGHGDYRSFVLAPASVQEMMELTVLAFDLADDYRMPAMILGDGLIGQMMEPVVMMQVPGSKNKKEKNWALTGCAGRKPRIIKSLILEEGALEAFNYKLQEKYAQAKKAETRFEAVNTEDAECILVGYGSVARTLRAVMLRLRAQGVKVGLVRPITLWPFPEKELARLAQKTKRFFVVEMSCGQMVEDVRLAVNGAAAVDFFGRPGGGIPGEEEIIAKILGAKAQAKK